MLTLRAVIRNFKSPYYRTLIRADNESPREAKLMEEQKEDNKHLGGPFGRSSKWYQSLPPEECNYGTTAVRIPVADDVSLSGDLYFPKGLPEDREPKGFVLILGCYGRGSTSTMLNAVVFASRGYQALLVSSRGTFGSEGVFVPGMSEQADSQAIVKWLRTQPWYPGRFATFGASYLGYTQWALLHDPPLDLAASIILSGPHDQAVHTWDKGVFRMDRISWNYTVATLEGPKIDSGTGNRILSSKTEDLRAVYEAVPLQPAVKRCLKGAAPWLQNFMSTSDIDDKFWTPVRHGVALDRVNIPVMLGSGWYDTFAYQSMEQYERLRDRGCKVNLTVGPWTHMDACGLHSMPEVLDFLDEHLAGAHNCPRPLPVKAFVSGTNEWRWLPVWPPFSSKRTFYLCGDCTLATKPPRSDSPSTTFKFDPACPTPTLGGPLLTGGGRVDDSAYSRMSDINVYTSTPLREHIEVMGKPVVELAHSTDIPYADIFVRLSEVDHNGVSHNISEVYEGLDPQREKGSVLLTLHDCAHVFRKGTCIRLVVAGGSFPLMARNLGCAGNRTMMQEMNPVKHTTEHADGVSRMTLPCSYS
ncbi:putative hydrolase [Fonsecaea pedrosoi]|nr:putative hydrolase [Fonsecaea pedrosoi]